MSGLPRPRSRIVNDLTHALDFSRKLMRLRIVELRRCVGQRHDARIALDRPACQELRLLDFGHASEVIREHRDVDVALLVRLVACIRAIQGHVLHM